MFDGLVRQVGEVIVVEHAVRPELEFEDVGVTYPNVVKVLLLAARYRELAVTVMCSVAK
jgi:hypothetical protein